MDSSKKFLQENSTRAQKPCRIPILELLNWTNWKKRETSSGNSRAEKTEGRPLSLLRPQKKKIIPQSKSYRLVYQRKLKRWRNGMEDSARKRRTEENKESPYHRGRITNPLGSCCRWWWSFAAWSKQSKTAPQSEFCDARKKPELEMKRQRKRSWRVNGGIFF